MCKGVCLTDIILYDGNIWKKKVEVYSLCDVTSDRWIGTSTSNEVKGCEL